MKEVTKTMKLALEFLIDMIAPPDPEVRKIELMTPEAFLEAAMTGERLEELPDVSHFLPYRSDVVKTAILELKDHENRKIASLLARLLYDFLLCGLSDLESFQNFSRPIILPIPITRKKKRKRGFNQCELLADAMKKSDISNMFEIRTNILVKTRESGDQKTKDKQARSKNLENCFSVRDPSLVRGRNIIVFDDVVTTGATLNEAKKTLIASGAKKVICIALAH